MKFFVWLCSLVIIKLSNAQFMVPPVKLEAFSPTGIRVYMEALPGIELFGFHGKINEEFKQIEPGDFTEDIKVPKNGYFVYDNPNLRVKVGDEVNYWVFVQHNQLGYRVDNQKWKIKELKVRDLTSCQSSTTIVGGKDSVCSNSFIFQDEFNSNSLDTNKWLWEQYIPSEPDYEFVSYQKDATVTKLQNNQFMIKPRLQSEDILKTLSLDLSDGCTRSLSNRSKCSNKFFFQNPIVSGRIVSTTNFLYADVDIKAKLPLGDWIYPQIYLEDDNYKKIVIAYARGNKILKGNKNEDIGGSLLFGGPMVAETEPDRSKMLSSYKHSQHLSDGFHTYRLRWTPDQIELFLDGSRYGLISREVLNSSGFVTNLSKTRLVLGVGVGGITDFPDNYQSDYPKPWRNRERKQLKKFYEARDKWLPSWNNDGVLQVEYVRIKSI